MEQIRFERLVVLMHRMATSDRAAMFSLAHEFGPEIVRAVRMHLRSLGVERLDREELDGLAIDACEVLYDLAGTWRPEGGALPWVWAGHRLRGIASRYVGQHADPLDADEVAEVPAPAPAPSSEPDELDLLEVLARTNSECALLQEALVRVTTPRNRAIFLALRLQEALGDRSPAVTVGQEFGLRPDAVRQIKHRTRQRLQALADDDPRFQPLADLPLLVA